MSVDIIVKRVDFSALPVFAQAVQHQSEISQVLMTLESVFQTTHRALAGSRYAFLLVAMKRDEIIGFICGTTDTTSVPQFHGSMGSLCFAFTAAETVGLRRIHGIVETLLYCPRKRL